MYVCVDFDGTIVEHEFPEIGRPVPGAIDWMKAWAAAGAKLILWTMRSDCLKAMWDDEWGKYEGADADYLRAAEEYCRNEGVEFYAVNRNPSQGCWTSSPKAYAHIYVDDAALGCPLKESARMGGRPYVDWEVVGPAVMNRILEEGSK